MEWNSIDALMSNQLLGAFDRENLEHYGIRLKVTDQERLKDKPTEYVIMQCDDRDHVKYVDYAIFNGLFYRPENKWKLCLPF